MVLKNLSVVLSTNWTPIILELTRLNCDIYGKIQCLKYFHWQGARRAGVEGQISNIFTQYLSCLAFRCQCFRGWWIVAARPVLCVVGKVDYIRHPCADTLTYLSTYRYGIHCRLIWRNTTSSDLYWSVDLYNDMYNCVYRIGCRAQTEEFYYHINTLDHEKTYKKESSNRIWKKHK